MYIQDIKIDVSKIEKNKYFYYYEFIIQIAMQIVFFANVNLRRFDRKKLGAKSMIFVSQNGKVFSQAFI